MVLDENEVKDEGAAIAHFYPTQKKKNKKVVLQDAVKDAGETLAKKTESLLDRTGDDEAGDGIVLHSVILRKGVATFTRMRRVYNILGDNNQELARDRRRTVLRTAQVLREGTKKTVLANYMEIYDYVKCLGCNSVDTVLSKENHLLFIRCEKCGSGRSVAPIKAGFVAQVGRRNAGT